MGETHNGAFDKLNPMEKEIANLTDRVWELGSLVVDATSKATLLLQTFDQRIVAEIMDLEEAINDLEVAIENDCLHLLEAFRPVSRELRMLIVIPKVVNDLERMGDQVVNVAERIEYLADKERLVSDLDFVKMCELASRMVTEAVSALIRQDSERARMVIEMDDELDVLNARSFDMLQRVMMQRPEMVRPAVSYLTISSNLERLGDLATNIAEQIVFIDEGQVIRHQSAIP